MPFVNQQRAQRSSFPLLTTRFLLCAAQMGGYNNVHCHADVLTDKTQRYALTLTPSIPPPTCVFGGGKQTNENVKETQEFAVKLFTVFIYLFISEFHLLHFINSLIIRYLMQITC